MEVVWLFGYSLQKMGIVCEEGEVEMTELEDFECK